MASADTERLDANPGNTRVEYGAVNLRKESGDWENKQSSASTSRKILWAGVAVLFVVALAATGALLASGLPVGGKPDTAEAVKAHENHLWFHAPNIQNFKFDMAEYRITSGQPWQYFDADIENGKAFVMAKAGRKGSGDVASWFRSKVGSGQAIGTAHGSGFPDKLNFAFIGKMSFTLGGVDVVLQDVVIGQGHFGSTNNWWFGGNDWKVIFNAGPIAVGVQSTQVFKLQMVLVGYMLNFNADELDLSLVSA